MLNVPPATWLRLRGNNLAIAFTDTTSTSRYAGIDLVHLTSVRLFHRHLGFIRGSHNGVSVAHRSCTANVTSPLRYGNPSARTDNVPSWPSMKNEPPRCAAQGPGSFPMVVLSRIDCLSSARRSQCKLAPPSPAGHRLVLLRTSKRHPGPHLVAHLNYGLVNACTSICRSAPGRRKSESTPRTPPYLH